MKSTLPSPVSRKGHKSAKARWKPPPVKPTGELLTKRDICAELAISQRTLETWVHDGEFPAPGHSPGQTKRWLASVVEKFIEDAMSQIPTRENA